MENRNIPFVVGQNIAQQNVIMKATEEIVGEYLTKILKKIGKNQKSINKNGKY